MKSLLQGSNKNNFGNNEKQTNTQINLHDGDIRPYDVIYTIKASIHPACTEISFS